MKIKSQTLLVIFFFFCLLCSIKAKRDIKSRSNDFTNWSVNDLKNELKKYGEDVAEGIQRTELVQRLNNYYSGKKNMLNQAIQSLNKTKDSIKDTIKEKVDDATDFSSWSVEDLRRELKKNGQNVAHGVRRAILVHRLNKFYQQKKNSLIQTKDFSSWSVSDLTRELKRNGQEVAEGMQRSELVHRLQRFYKDQTNKAKNIIKDKVNGAKDLTNWSVSDLTRELKKNGQQVAEGMQRSELVHRLNHFYKQQKDSVKDAKDTIKDKVSDAKDTIKDKVNDAKDTIKEKVEDAKEDVKDFADWTLGDITSELQRHGQIVAEGVQRTELVQMLSKFFHEKKENIKDKFFPKDENGEIKDFSNWSIGDLTAELQRHGQIVAEGIGKTELVKSLGEFYENQRDSLKERFYPKNENGDAKDFADWSIGDLTAELKKNGQVVAEGIAQSELAHKLAEFYKNQRDSLGEKTIQLKDTIGEKTVQLKDSIKENFFPKDENGEVKDFSEWSVSDLTAELKRNGQIVADGITQSDLAHKLAEFYKNQRDSLGEKAQAIKDTITEKIYGEQPPVDKEKMII